MPEPDLYGLFVAPLNGLKIRYVVSRSVAAMLYGEPRFTHENDWIQRLSLENEWRRATE